MYVAPLGTVIWYTCCSPWAMERRVRNALATEPAGTTLFTPARRFVRFAAKFTAPAASVQPPAGPPLMSTATTDALTVTDRGLAASTTASSYVMSLLATLISHTPGVGRAMAHGAEVGGNPQG